MRLVRQVLMCSGMVLAPLFIRPSEHALAGQESRRIEVTAKRFTYTPAEITLKQGEPVVLVLHSEDVTHGFRLKEFDLNTEVQKGNPSELRFTPEQIGTFVAQCSHFCGAGHGEMVLTFHITE